MQNNDIKNIKYDKLSDDELILALRGGDSKAADYLYNKYKPLVSKNVSAKFIAGGDTEDLIQEGMIGLFGAISDYDIEGAASFYTLDNLVKSNKRDKKEYKIYDHKMRIHIHFDKGINFEILIDINALGNKPRENIRQRWICLLK